MQGRVEWREGSKAIGINSRGQELEFDWNDGPSPMQVTLQMVGMCSMVDVVEGLKQRSFSEVWVDLDSERAEEKPRSFTAISMVYNVRGDVPQKLVERIVQKSHEKYCSVSNTLNEKVEFSWTVKIHPESDA